MKDQSIIINLIQLYKMIEMFISVSHMCIIIINYYYYYYYRCYYYYHIIIIILSLLIIMKLSILSLN